MLKLFSTFFSFSLINLSHNGRCPNRLPQSGYFLAFDYTQTYSALVILMHTVSIHIKTVAPSFPTGSGSAALRLV